MLLTDASLQGLCQAYKSFKNKGLKGGARRFAGPRWCKVESVFRNLQMPARVAPGHTASRSGDCRLLIAGRCTSAVPIAYSPVNASLPLTRKQDGGTWCVRLTRLTPQRIGWLYRPAELSDLTGGSENTDSPCWRARDRFRHCCLGGGLPSALAPFSVGAAPLPAFGAKRYERRPRSRHGRSQRLRRESEPLHGQKRTALLTRPISVRGRGAPGVRVRRSDRVCAAVAPCRPFVWICRPVPASVRCRKGS